MTTTAPEPGPRGSGYDVTTIQADAETGTGPLDRLTIAAEAACAPLDDNQFGEGIVEGEDDAE